MFDDVAQPEGKVGAKKLKKLQEKAERKAMREVVCLFVILFVNNNKS